MRKIIDFFQEIKFLKYEVFKTIHSFYCHLPLTRLFEGFDCECSFSDGDGGHYSIAYDCGGGGQAVLQHFAWNADPNFATTTHIVANPGSNGPC